MKIAAAITVPQLTEAAKGVSVLPTETLAHDSPCLLYSEAAARSRSQNCRIGLGLKGGFRLCLCVIIEPSDALSQKC